MTSEAVTRLAAVLGTGRKLSALAVVAALGFAGCGSDEGGTIPQSAADEMLTQVDEIDKSVAEQDCTAAKTNITQLRGQVDALPSSVGTKTKTELFKLVQNMEEQVDDPEQCEEPDTGASGEEAVVPEEETTVPVEETEEAPVAPEEEPAPEQPEDEGTGLPGPGNSDNGPPGNEGNPNSGDSGGVGD